MNYYHYKYTHQNSGAALFGIVAAIVFVSLLYFFVLRVAHTETMVVRSKEWFREVQELEDYRTWECHTEEKCNGFGEDKVCTNHQKCDWVKHTRTINSWQLSGIYPDKPQWPNYTISPGHYERKFQWYIIKFSDDKKLYPYRTYREDVYNSLNIKSSHKVSLNMLGFIVKVEAISE